jgi:hypothetical protein
VAVEVFEGNTADPMTLGAQIAKIKARFDLKRVVLVGDRGMITQARLDVDHGLAQFGDPRVARRRRAPHAGQGSIARCKVARYQWDAPSERGKFRLREGAWAMDAYRRGSLATCLGPGNPL